MDTKHAKVCALTFLDGKELEQAINWIDQAGASTKTQSEFVGRLHQLSGTNSDASRVALAAHDAAADILKMNKTFKKIDIDDAIRARLFDYMYNYNSPKSVTSIKRGVTNDIEVKLTKKKAAFRWLSGVLPRAADGSVNLRGANNVLVKARRGDETVSEEAKNIVEESIGSLREVVDEFLIQNPRNKAALNYKSRLDNPQMADPARLSKYGLERFVKTAAKYLDNAESKETADLLTKYYENTIVREGLMGGEQVTLPFADKTAIMEFGNEFGNRTFRNEFEELKEELVDLITREHAFAGADLRTFVGKVKTSYDELFESQDGAFKSQKGNRWEGRSDVMVDKYFRTVENQATYFDYRESKAFQNASKMDRGLMHMYASLPGGVKRLRSLATMGQLSDSFLIIFASDLGLVTLKSLSDGINVFAGGPFKDTMEYLNLTFRGNYRRRQLELMGAQLDRLLVGPKAKTRYGDPATGRESVGALDWVGRAWLTPPL